jgi:hypothetical protein
MYSPEDGCANSRKVDNPGRNHSLVLMGRLESELSQARAGSERLAYLSQGDTAKTKSAYQDSLTLWKDADPDIPILKQAKSEYGKLN